MEGNQIISLGLLLKKCTQLQDLTNVQLIYHDNYNDEISWDQMNLEEKMAQIVSKPLEIHIAWLNFLYICDISEEALGKSLKMSSPCMDESDVLVLYKMTIFCLCASVAERNIFNFELLNENKRELWLSGLNIQTKNRINQTKYKQFNNDKSGQLSFLFSDLYKRTQFSGKNRQLVQDNVDGFAVFATYLEALYNKLGS